MVVRSLILLALVAFPLILAAVPGQSAHMKARSPRSLEDISTCTNACLARNNQCVAECSPFDVDCVMNCVKTHAGRCTCGCKKELPSDALIPSRSGIETLKLSNLTIPLLGATRETYPGEVLAIVGCVSDAVQDVNDCTFRCPANPPFDCETSCYTQFFYRVCSCSNIGGSGASSTPIVASSLLAAALVVATSCS